MGIYEKYIRKHKHLSNKDLAEIIKESGEVNAKLSSIKGRIRATKSKLDKKDPGWKEDTLVVEEKENRRDIKGKKTLGDGIFADFADDVYVVNLAEGKERLSFEAIQKIFEWYSAPESLNIKEVLTKLNKDLGLEFSEKEFYNLKRKLNLTRKSMPFAPHMYVYHDPEYLHKKYLRKCESKVDIKIKAGEADHWYKKFKKERKKTLSVEKFFDDIKNSITTFEFPDVEPLDLYAPLKPTDKGLILSDWHVGKMVDRSFNQYNLAVFKRYIVRLKQEIAEHFKSNKRPVENFYICCLGDLVDGVGGNMHPQQNAHQDVHGAEQILHAGLALADVVNFVNELLPDTNIHVEFVSGNHDRISKDRRGDPNRVAGEAVFYMARESSDLDDVNWSVYRDVVSEVKIKNTQVLLTHGDKSPKDYRKLVHARKDPDAKYYMVLLGHLHHLSVIEDLSMVKITNGSLPGKDDYGTDQLGVGSRSSQAMFEVREDGPRPLFWIPLDR